jgi:hypothetical protein
LTIVDNFRPVCLISHFLKLINLLLLKRLRDSADKFLRYGQNGFRPHRGTMTHAMALRMMADVGDPMYLLFVDFSSAFPSVTFASIESALRSFQVPQRIIDAVMRCHHGHKVRIKGEDGIPLSECYEMLTGVMQGDTLAPYLFIMVLDCLLCELEEEKLLTGFPLSQRTVTHEGPRRTTRSASAVNTSVVHELGFADDLLFPCAKFEDMEPLLRALRDKAKSIGLDINLKKGKTEYILVNVDKEKFAGKNVTCPDANGTMVTIHCAEDYTYLGTNTVSLEAQLNKRVGLAWCAIKKFRPFWRSKAPYEVRLALFVCLIQSVLTYGMELLNAPLIKQLDKVYGRMLQHVFGGGINRSTVERYNHGRVPHLSSLLILRRIKLVGHALRRDEPLSRVLKEKSIMTFNRKENKSRFGTRDTLVKAISKDLSELGDEEYSVKLATDHTSWPKPNDRAAWRKLANERAAENEDAIYRELAASRAARLDSDEGHQNMVNRVYNMILESMIPEEHRILLAHEVKLRTASAPHEQTKLGDSRADLWLQGRGGYRRARRVRQLPSRTLPCDLLLPNETLPIQRDSGVFEYSYSQEGPARVNVFRDKV